MSMPGRGYSGPHGHYTAIATAIHGPPMIPFGPGFPIPQMDEFIKSFESCKLAAYQDSGGLWTIGWGHKSPEIHSGLIWTQAQADEQFEKDLAVRVAAVRAEFTVTLTPGQLLALVSLSYNIGVGAIHTSHLRQLINQNSLAAAVLEFPRWDHVGPTDSRGLLQRRLAEAMCFVRDSHW